MKKITIVTIVMAMFLSWSCKEGFLKLAPQTGQVSDEDFFKTKADFESYIFGAYSEWTGRFGDPGKGIGGMLTLGAYLSQDWTSTDEVPFVLDSYMDPSNSGFKNYWVTCYKVATRANLVLARLDDAPIDDTDKTLIEGEAKFLRGLAYSYLAKGFGNVPLVLDEYDPSQNHMSCSPEADVWQQVISDFTDAAQKLPKRDDWGEENMGRATKGSALALLANAYMYTKEWAKAEEASTDLIALGDYNLLPDVRKVFSPSHPNTRESIFEIQNRNVKNGDIVWGGAPVKGTALHIRTAPRNIGSEWAGAGGWGTLIANRKLPESFELGDERRTKLMVAPGEKYKGERMADTLLIPLDIMQANSAFSTKYWVGPAPDDGPYVGDADLPVMRYAEFLLNYAEILFNLGKTDEAYEQLNMVRERVSLPPLTASSDLAVFMKALMNEVRWELNCEPNFWFHFLRTKTAAEFLQTEHGVTMNPAWYKFPIPQSEIDQNPNLCQNDGY